MGDGGREGPLNGTLGELPYRAILILALSVGPSFSFPLTRPVLPKWGRALLWPIRNREKGDDLLIKPPPLGELLLVLTPMRHGIAGIIPLQLQAIHFFS
jgi:hypothetical protein